MWTLVVPALALCAAQSDDAAAALLKQTQTQLAKAKVLQIRFDGVWERKKDDEEKFKTRKLSGSLSLSLKERTFTAQQIIDKDTPYTKSTKGDGVPDLGAQTLEAVGRAGMWVPFFLLESSGDDVKEQGFFMTDPKQLDSSAPKLAGKEKVGGREAQIVEFTLKSKNGNLVIRNKVWIDTERQLPIQWEVTATRGKWRFLVMEKFEKIELGD